MGRLIDIECKGCELIIHANEHNFCVTMIGWVDVQDSDQGDFRHWYAVDISSCIKNTKHHMKIHLYYSLINVAGWTWYTW